MNKPFPEKPKIQEHFSVAFTGRNRVLFKSLSKEFEMNIIIDKTKFKKLILGLDGKHTFSGLMQSLDVEKDKILEILTILDLKGALGNGENCDVANPKLISKLEFKKRSSRFSPPPSSFIKNKPKFQKKLASSKMVIFSTGNIGHLVMDRSCSLGVKEVQGVMIRKVKNIVSNRCIGTVVNNGNANSGIVEISSIKDIKDVIKNYDLVIACPDSAFSFLYLWINKACIKLGIPWLSGRIEGIEGVIGPTVIPHRSSCYNCYRLRLKENEYIRERDYIIRSKISLPSRGINLLESLIADCIVLEGIRVLTKSAKPMLLNHILSISVLNLQNKFDEIIKKTTCSHCGDRFQREKDRHDIVLEKTILDLKDINGICKNGDLRVVPVSETIKKAKRLTGKVGIITKVERIESNKKILPVFHAVSAGPGNERIDRNHFGRGVTSEEAKAGAIGEAIERYCAKMQGDEEIVVASFEDLKKDAMDPESFILPMNFSNKYTRNVKIGWSQGYSLCNNRPVFVPSDFVYLPYRPKRGAIQISTGSSVGLAAGNCPEEAILHGIFEVVEKDAWCIMERNRLCMPDVDAGGVKDKDVHRIFKKLKARKVSFYIKDLTTDIKITTIGTFFEHISNGRCTFSYAAGTHLNPEIALLRSLTEAAQLYPLCLSEQLEKNPEYKIEHRVQKGRCKIKFGKIPNLSSGNMKKDIKICTEMVNHLGMDVIIVDLTRPNIGFSVVRVLIPGLQPIYNYNFPRYSRRLFEMPRLLGYKGRNSIKEEMYNGGICGWLT